MELSGTSPDLTSRFRILSKWLGWGTFFVASAILLEWIFIRSRNDAFTSPLTAVMFQLSWIALLLKFEEPENRKPINTKISNIICYVMLSVCLIKIALIFSDFDNVINNHLTQVFHSSSNRTLLGMAENTIANFLLSSVAILILDYETKNNRRVSQLLCFVIFFISLVASYGHVTNVVYLYTLFTAITIAPTTILCFFLLALSILLSRPNTGFMRLLVGEHLMQNFTMRLLGTLTPLILSYLKLKAVEYHVIPKTAGTAIFTFLTYLLSLFLIGLNTTFQKKIRRINRIAFEKLKWNELRLKTITENITEGVLIVRPNSGIVFINSVAKKIFGYFDKTTPIEKWPEDLGIYKDDGKTLYDHKDLTIANALQGTNKDNLEAVVKNSHHPNGVTLLTTGRSVLNNKGEVVEGILIYRDISERKKIEKKYYESSIIIRRILSNSYDALVVIDNDGNLIYSNKAAEEIIGKFPSSINIKNWTKYFGFYYPDKFTMFPPSQLPFNQALKGHDTSEIDLYVNNSNIKGKYISISCKTVKDENNIVHGVIITIRSND